MWDIGVVADVSPRPPTAVVDAGDPRASPSCVLGSRPFDKK
jgi:hypothetical protein